jgi:hypothetical protein
MKTLVALVAALGVAALSTAALAQEDCDSGSHWDEDSQACVPDES